MSNKDSLTRAEIMRAHIECCRSGGHTVAAYCKEHGLVVSNYYYWQKRLGPASVKEAFTELPAVAIQAVAVAVRYPNGVCLELSGGVDLRVLKELICCM